MTTTSTTREPRDRLGALLDLDLEQQLGPAAERRRELDRRIEARLADLGREQILRGIGNMGRAR